MNANELADELREVSKHSEPHTKIVLGIAESLLRQQQADIELLEKRVDEVKDTNGTLVDLVQLQRQEIDKLRQQQAEMEELEKENTDLRYLIATKLEQQDGISLNSMAHPITNTPEPSYEIDLDKLETIEIDLPSPEPVAWMNPKSLECGYGGEVDWGDTGCIPLYTHPVKELTDEEIKQLQRECITDAYAQAHFHGDKYINSQQAILNFARAILRKAQEK